MIVQVFTNIAYGYYPRKIDNYLEKDNYQNSLEYKKLSKVLIGNNQYSEQEEIKFFKNELSKRFNVINDSTLLHWEDRCITYQIPIVIHNCLTIINIHISFLIPYYIIYITDCILKSQDNFGHMKRNISKEENQHNDDIKFIDDKLNRILKYHRFEESLLNYVIPDISFRDIRFGKFTIYNAFFMDEKRF